jgi:hypothetical protein
MRTRLISAVVVSAACGLTIAGCGAQAAAGSAHNIAKSPPAPSITPRSTEPAPSQSPTLGDPCLVGTWRQTTGSLLWEGNEAGAYGNFTATPTGGAGATLRIAGNGAAVWNNDSSQSYTASVQDYYTNPPQTTLAVQLSGEVTGTITGDYNGSATSMYWAETTPGEPFGESGTYNGARTDQHLVADAPLENPFLTYSCSASTLTISGLMPGGTSPPTTFTKVSG